MLLIYLNLKFYLLIYLSFLDKNKVLLSNAAIIVTNDQLIVCCNVALSMYSNKFQGGPYVDIFVASGKDPLMKSKPVNVQREYDKDVKGYVYYAEGSTTTAKIHFPVGNGRQTLGLIQR